MPNEIVIHTPSADGSEYGPLVAQARVMEVFDKETHKAAQGVYAMLSAARKAVKSLWAEPKRAAHAAHKTITRREGEMDSPLMEAQSMLGARITGYEAEAERKAWLERLRLEALARAAEDERRLQQAVALEAEGASAEEVQAVLEDVAPAPIIRVEPETARVEGVSTRTLRRAEVRDKMAVIRYVAEHPEFESLLDVNMPAANAFARAQGEALAIPGLVLVTDVSRAVKL